MSKKKKDEIPEKPANNATKKELWEHVDKLENYIGNLREQLGLITQNQINRTAKNDVFVHLFSLPEYQLKLYQELFPTDTSVTADDIELITLKELMANYPYNDLGLLVRNVLILLLEAQSTWPINITHEAIPHDPAVCKKLHCGIRSRVGKSHSPMGDGMITYSFG